MISTSSDRPRVVQYITMSPAQESDEQARTARITGWRDRLAGFGENRQEKEHRQGETAELTALGRKLLGLDHWGE